MFRPVPRLWRVLDIIGSALGLFVTLPISLIVSSQQLSYWLPASAMTTALYALVGVALWGAVAFSRSSPQLALIIAWAAAIVQMACGFWPSGYNLAIPIVLFATAAWGSSTTLWWGAGSALAGGTLAGGYITLLAAPQLVTDTDLGIRIATVFVLSTSFVIFMLVIGWGPASSGAWS